MWKECSEIFPQAARKPAERRTTGNLISFFFFFFLSSSKYTGNLCCRDWKWSPGRKQCRVPRSWACATAEQSRAWRRLESLRESDAEKTGFTASNDVTIASWQQAPFIVESSAEAKTLKFLSRAGQKEQRWNPCLDEAPVDFSSPESCLNFTILPVALRPKCESKECPHWVASPPHAPCHPALPTVIWPLLVYCNHIFYHCLFLFYYYLKWNFHLWLCKYVFLGWMTEAKSQCLCRWSPNLAIKSFNLVCWSRVGLPHGWPGASCCFSVSVLPGWLNSQLRKTFSGWDYQPPCQLCASFKGQVCKYLEILKRNSDLRWLYGSTHLPSPVPTLKPRYLVDCVLWCFVSRLQCQIQNAQSKMPA